MSQSTPGRGQLLRQPTSSPVRTQASTPLPATPPSQRQPRRISDTLQALGLMLEAGRIDKDQFNKAFPVLLREHERSVAPTPPAASRPQPQPSRSAPPREPHSHDPTEPSADEPADTIAPKADRVAPDGTRVWDNCADAMYAARTEGSRFDNKGPRRNGSTTEFRLRCPGKADGTTKTGLPTTISCTARRFVFKRPDGAWTYTECGEHTEHKPVGHARVQLPPHVRVVINRCMKEKVRNARGQRTAGAVIRKVRIKLGFSNAPRGACRNYVKNHFQRKYGLKGDLLNMKKLVAENQRQAGRSGKAAFFITDVEDVGLGIIGLSCGDWLANLSHSQDCWGTIILEIDGNDHIFPGCHGISVATHNRDHRVRPVAVFIAVGKKGVFYARAMKLVQDAAGPNVVNWRGDGANEIYYGFKQSALPGAKFFRCFWHLCRDLKHELRRLLKNGVLNSAMCQTIKDDFWAMHLAEDYVFPLAKAALAQDWARKGLMRGDEEARRATEAAAADFSQARPKPGRPFPGLTEADRTEHKRKVLKEKPVEGIFSSWFNCNGSWHHGAVPRGFNVSNYAAESTHSKMESMIREEDAEQGKDMTSFEGAQFFVAYGISDWAEAFDSPWSPERTSMLAYLGTGKKAKHPTDLWLKAVRFLAVLTKEPKFFLTTMLMNQSQVWFFHGKKNGMGRPFTREDQDRYMAIQNSMLGHQVPEWSDFKWWVHVRRVSQVRGGIARCNCQWGQMHGVCHHALAFSLKTGDIVLPDEYKFFAEKPDRRRMLEPPVKKTKAAKKNGDSQSGASLRPAEEKTRGDEFLLRWLLDDWDIDQTLAVLCGDAFQRGQGYIRGYNRVMQCMGPNAVVDYLHEAQGDVPALVQLMVLNTHTAGSHWVLGVVDLQKKHLELYDPYPTARVAEESQLAQMVEDCGWTVACRPHGTQDEEDGTTCGFHCLFWIAWMVAKEVNSPPIFRTPAGFLYLVYDIRDCLRRQAHNDMRPITIDPRALSFALTALPIPRMDIVEKPSRWLLCLPEPPEAGAPEAGVVSDDEFNLDVKSTGSDSADEDSMDEDSDHFDQEVSEDEEGQEEKTEKAADAAQRTRGAENDKDGEEDEEEREDGGEPGREQQAGKLETRKERQKHFNQALGLQEPERRVDLRDETFQALTEEEFAEKHPYSCSWKFGARLTEVRVMSDGKVGNVEAFRDKYGIAWRTQWLSSSSPERQQQKETPTFTSQAAGSQPSPSPKVDSVPGEEAEVGGGEKGRKRKAEESRVEERKRGTGAGGKKKPPTATERWVKEGKAKKAAAVEEKGVAYQFPHTGKDERVSLREGELDEGIVGVIKRHWKDQAETICRALVTRGYRRASEFKYARCSKATFDSFRKVGLWEGLATEVVNVLRSVHPVRCRRADCENELLVTKKCEKNQWCSRACRRGVQD